MSAEHIKEYSWSCKKPSSESHAWSFKQACDYCLEEIRTEYGADYRITDVTFEDLGRETKGEVDWTGKRTWRCTHKVKATYKVEHRGTIESFTEMEYIEESLNIKFKMKNNFYKL